MEVRRLRLLHGDGVPVPMVPDSAPSGGFQKVGGRLLSGRLRHPEPLQQGMPLPGLHPGQPGIHKRSGGAEVQGRANQGGEGAPPRRGRVRMRRPRDPLSDLPFRRVAPQKATPELLEVPGLPQPPTAAPADQGRAVTPLTGIRPFASKRRRYAPAAAPIPLRCAPSRRRGGAGTARTDGSRPPLDRWFRTRRRPEIPEGL